MKPAPEVAPLQGQLGCPVTDELTDRTGTLMAVMAYDEVSHAGGLAHLGKTDWVAFIRPDGGGREWVTVPEAVRVS